jgi:raffinose/stachyose/melibiose transport system substrate-binding protein
MFSGVVTMLSFSRQFFTRLALVLIAVAMSAATLPTQNIQAQNTTLSGELSVYLQAYYNTDANPETSAIAEKIAKSYEELHPGVKITLVPDLPSGTDYATWLTTRMAAGQAPDIGWEQYTTRNSTHTDWWVPLNKYLDEPNPYIAKGAKGSEKWADSIQPYVLTQIRAADGNWYQVSLDWVETALYYNVDLFKKAGIATKWSSWSAFVADMKKLKQATGADAIGMNIAQQGWSPWYWADDTLLSAVWYDKAKEFYLPKYAQPGSEIRQLNPEEVAKAILDGKLSASDPKMDTYLKLSKDFVGLMPADYATLTGGDLDRLFLSGKIATQWNGSWAAKNLQRDATFGFDVTYLPNFTKDDLGTHSAPAFRVGGPSAAAQYGITRAAEKAGKLALAVDFLKYLSAPQNIGQLIKAQGGFIPMVIGADSSSIVANFSEVAALPERVFNDPDGRLVAASGDAWTAAMQAYFVGVADEAATKTALQKIWMDGAKELCTKNKYDWCPKN